MLGTDLIDRAPDTDMHRLAPGHRPLHRGGVGDIVNPLDPTLYVLLGIAAFLGAGYRVPLAAVMFVAEATGQPGFIVPALFAAVAAELVKLTRGGTGASLRDVENITDRFFYAAESSTEGGDV